MEDGCTLYAVCVEVVCDGRFISSDSLERWF